MKVIIDRFEEDTAIVELDGEMLSAPRALFGDASEGDTIEINNLGKTPPDDLGSPHAIFERLRRKRRGRNG